MKKYRLIFLLALIFSLTVSSTAFANSSTSEVTGTENTIQSSTGNNADQKTIDDKSVKPQNVGGTYAGAYISLNSTGTALWYSGNLSSANAWISASCKVSLQWMSPLGGSWQTEINNDAVENENATKLSTPTYTLPSVTWGYWRSTNYYVAYWPSNIVPSYLSNTVYSNQLYYEQ